MQHSAKSWMPLVALFFCAVMALLFLSPRSGRAQAKVVSKYGDAMTRKFFLLEEPWVLDLAERHGLRDVVAEQRERKRLADRGEKEFKGICSILCLVSVSPGKLGHGILTDWTAEEEHYRKGFFDTPESTSSQSTFSLCVDKVLAFLKPIPAHSPQRFHSDFWEPGKFDLEQIHMWTGKTCEELEIHFGKSAEEIMAFLQKPIALRVPVLLCHLIAKGAWRAIVLNGGDFGKKGAQSPLHLAFQQELGGFPPAEWVDHAVADHKRKRSQEEAVELRFRPTDAKELASFLRSWSGRILPQAPEEMRQELQLMLEEKVMRLDSFAGNKKGLSRSEFGPEQLLHALCAAMGVRDRSKLADTFRHLLKCRSQPTILSDLGEDPGIPSPAVISRSQIRIDGALCGFWKERFAAWMESTNVSFNPASSDLCVFLWADSSPQAGTDWLLSQMRIIPPGKLSSCVAAAELLQDSAAVLVSLAQEQSSESGLQARNESLWNLVLERHKAGLALQDAILKHCQIPIGLGSGPKGSTLEHKLICIVKKFLAETHSQNLAQRVMTRVLGICTDMGTEIGFAQLEEGFAWKQILPAYMQNSGLETEEDVLARCFASEAGAESNFLFPNALSSPGMLHICHNLCTDLHTSLEGYAGWLAGFKAIAALLHSGHLRKQYIGKLLLGTPWQHFERLLQTGIERPASWRWFSIQKALPRILERKHMLQITWDADKFSKEEGRAGDNAADQGGRRAGLIDEDADLQMPALTSAVESEAWWLYTRMLLALNRFPADLAAWSEGCSCHPWLQHKRTYSPKNEMSSQDPDKNFATQAGELLDAIRREGGFKAGEGDGYSGYGPCPLAGQRSMDLASGEVWKRLDAWSDEYTQDLLQHNQCTDEGDIATALRDFSCGKAFIVAYLRQKLQCWETFPWKLAALNCERSIAQRIAQEAIIQFDQTADSTANPADDLHALHHRLTLKFFKRGTPGRQDLEAFIRGTPLGDLPILNAMVYGLRFIPVVERVQEADHAITNMHTIHRGKISAPYISCRLRIAEIRAILEDPEALQRLLDIFQQLSMGPDIFARQCGVNNHVLWQEAENRKFEVRLKWGVLASILYSMDPASQYTKTKAIRQDRARKKSEQTAAGFSRNAKAWVDIEESEMVCRECGTACNGPPFAKQDGSGQPVQFLTFWLAAHRFERVFRAAPAN